MTPQDVLDLFGDPNKSAFSSLSAESNAEYKTASDLSGVLNFRNTL